MAPTEQVIERSGRYIHQPTGYRAFIPATLPPEPPIALDPSLLSLLSEADHALGQLDGVASILPNPDLFVAMYVREEAVISSQIEGTQSTLEDVLQYEMDHSGHQQPRDVVEVVNYVRAMNHGLERLKELPLSLRLIREIHRELMEGVRGQNREPGEFRRTQNWIGPPGCTLADAVFVPPPPHEMTSALDNFEKFLHLDTPMPVLIQCGVAHAQFESIHPFLDGNGRVGRLLITFLLCHRGILSRPLLYLSHHFKRYRTEYYDRLMAIRTSGDWEGWIGFFLTGVREVSREAVKRSRAILGLRADYSNRIQASLGPVTANGFRLLDLLFRTPWVTAAQAQEYLQCSFPTANQMISKFEQLGILHEVTGGKRNRQYVFSEYLDLFPSRRRIEEVMPVRKQ